jgi:glycosyltransferase involved in cell wall biosynthesis
MERIPKEPPHIAPVTHGKPRPKWSVMIPTYNCSNYLAEAIESVLLQDMGPEAMQIEVIDDHSIDADVKTLVEKVGLGRVGYYRQAENVGSLRNFETCINRAQGQYIHLLHGDDRIKKGYYNTLNAVFEQFPEAGAAFTAWENIDSSGAFSHRSQLEAKKTCILENWLYKLAEHPRLQYVAITVKREVYEALGSFYLAHYGEDWEMWARIAKHYPTAYCPEFLAEYRQHQNSITWRSYQTGQNVKDIGRVTTQITSYLPVKDQQKMLRNAQKNYVYWVLNETFGAWFTNKNNKLAYTQIKTILGIYRDRYIISRITILLLYIWSDPYRKIIKGRSN